MLASSGTNLGSTTLLRRPSHIDLSNCFSKSSYFSDINPRSMKRLMNILAVTGGILYFLYSLPSFVIGHFYQIIIQMFLTIPTGFTFWPIQICCSCWNLKKFRQRMHVTQQLFMLSWKIFRTIQPSYVSELYKKSQFLHSTDAYLLARPSQVTLLFEPSFLYTTCLYL